MPTDSRACACLDTRASRCARRRQAHALHNPTQRNGVVATKAAAKIRGRAQAFHDPRISLRRRVFSCIFSFAL